MKVTLSFFVLEEELCEEESRENIYLSFCL